VTFREEERSSSLERGNHLSICISYRRETQCICITKISQLMSFWEVLALYNENREEHRCNSEELFEMLMQVVHVGAGLV
jgi:hypothetical protein